ncbi:DUF1549 domain-containing protein [Paraliomyxa miuraensis]|uniref:DUF1549 domain-containing protein n=1 Tax=Paraliomyxa miuraensis TaxID=376150 RepID=UPI00225B8819|nr:DUF1549 domain-containing protein [Paraliomyxa miuraensis]MCX4244893.1 DUF1549 domain-containing protein [Paraliomyxa miuraensis]
MKKTVLWSAVAGLMVAAGCRGDVVGEPIDFGDDSTGMVPDSDGESTTGGEMADESSGTGSDTGEEVTACDEMTFDNVVDEAACPFIQDLGVSPSEADSVEFCRRAYIDLLGESPTDIEYEADCKWSTKDEIVDAFMARPEYVLVSQRMWGDVFHYTSAITHHQYIADLDALVAQLYQGTISYGVFAELAATHPAFLGRWDGLDLVGYSFLAFLGRDANPAERLALEPLWHMWGERDMPHPNQSNARNVVLDTRQCAAPNEADCYSDYWGEHTVIIPPPVPGDVTPNGPNVLDQASLTPEQWNQLRLPGRLIAERPTFHEAYVDRALRRYLGYDAGAELPTVRQALVDMLDQNGGDIREIEREILTSILYTSSNQFDEGEVDNPDDWAPPYWHGPVKQMDAEDWLRTAAKLTGVELGSCDHRYPEVQSGPSGLHPHNYPTMGAGNAPNYEFRDKAQLLGGCPDHSTQFRERRTGLIAALTQATLTTELCEAADLDSPIYPLQFIEDPMDKSEEALTTAANQVYSAAMVRPIPEAATDALMTGVSGCRDDLACTPADFAVETCRLTLKAADFLFY